MADQYANWPQHGERDAVGYDGTITHSCSNCPEFGPCPNQLWRYRDIVDRYPIPEVPCRVYWGTHGCHLERGHTDGHWCDCCTCKSHPDLDQEGCVGSAPWYGPDTHFYGEDVNG